VSPDAERLLVQTYAAFNARDIDAVLAVMSPDVEWPNGMEGGTMRGHRAVREYWTRQWGLIDPTVEPERFAITADGRVAVQVHQIVRNLRGAILKDEIVRHVYTFDGGRIVSMTIG
jgi:ketosteroid isomerase-like protein